MAINSDEAQLRHDAKDVLRIERALRRGRESSVQNPTAAYEHVQPSDYDAALRLVRYAVAKLQEEHTDG